MNVLLASALAILFIVWLKGAMALERGGSDPFTARFETAPQTHPLTLIASFGAVVILYSWRPYRRLMTGVRLAALAIVALAAVNIVAKATGLAALDQFEMWLGNVVFEEDSARFGWNTGLTLGLIAASQLLRRNSAMIGLSLAAVAPLLPLSAMIGHGLGIQTYFGDMSTTTISILTPIWAANLLSFSLHPAFRVLLKRSDLGFAGRWLVVFALVVPLLICGAIVIETLYFGLDQVVVLFALAMGWVSTILVLKVLRLQFDKEGERAAYVYQLGKMAVTDSLTGLPNRSGVPLTPPALLGCAAVLLLDLDKFKSINDTHGHEAGDRVLIAAARAMEAELRVSDVIARWGGEEFLAILRDISYEEALGVAERLRRAVAAVHVAEHPDISVTVSIGVAVVLNGEETIEGAICRADEALYQAKHKGRDQVIEASVENNVLAFRPVRASSGG